MQKHNVPIAAGMECRVAEDGRNVALVFAVGGKPLPVAIPTGSIGATIAELARAAQIAGTRNAGHIPPAGTALQVAPIPTMALGIAKGRRADEALLVAKIGTVDLVFSVELSNLLGTLESLRSMVSAAEPTSKSRPN